MAVLERFRMYGFASRPECFVRKALHSLPRTTLPQKPAVGNTANFETFVIVVFQFSVSVGQ